MAFQIIYILFLIGSLFYGSTYIVSAVTVRHVITVIMFLMCVAEDKRVWIDKYFGLYTIFLISFGLSSILTGFAGDFFKNLLAFYFVSYVGYWGTKILIQKGINIKTLIYPLLTFGMLDAVVSITQVTFVFDLSPVLNVIHIPLDEATLERFDGKEGSMGISVPGIMNDPVSNGEFLMVMVILSMFFQRKKFNIFGVLFTVVFLIGSFFTQQRSPFFISVIIMIYILYKNFFTRLTAIAKVLLIIPIIILLCCAVYEFIDFASADGSRFASTSMTGRDKIYQLALLYLKDNVLLGGIYSFSNQTHLMPHNFFLNALMYGGIVGGVILILTVVLQVIKILQYNHNRIKRINLTKLIFGCTYLAVVGNSMTHNSGIVSGSLIAWVVWGVFLFLPKYEEKKRALL